MSSCNTFRLTWVSLTLDVGISSWLLQQSTAAAPYLGRGRPPDLERAVAPLSLPLPMQPPLLEHEGSSSRPLPPTSNVG